MTAKPPSTMSLSQSINYYGAHSVPVDTLIVSLEKLEAIEDDAPEVAYLQQKVQELDDEVESLKEDLTSAEDMLADANRQIDRLQEELDAARAEADA